MERSSAGCRPESRKRETFAGGSLDRNPAAAYVFDASEKACSAGGIAARAPSRRHGFRGPGEATGVPAVFGRPFAAGDDPRQSHRRHARRLYVPRGTSARPPAAPNRRRRGAEPPHPSGCRNDSAFHVKHSRVWTRPQLLSAQGGQEALRSRLVDDAKQALQCPPIELRRRIVDQQHR